MKKFGNDFKIKILDIIVENYNILLQKESDIQKVYNNILEYSSSIDEWFVLKTKINKIKELIDNRKKNVILNPNNADDIIKQKNNEKALNVLLDKLKKLNSRKNELAKEIKPQREFLYNIAYKTKKGIIGSKKAIGKNKKLAVGVGLGTAIAVPSGVSLGRHRYKEARKKIEQENEE